MSLELFDGFELTLGLVDVNLSELVLLVYSSLCLSIWLLHGLEEVSLR